MNVTRVSISKHVTNYVNFYCNCTTNLVSKTCQCRPRFLTVFFVDGATNHLYGVTESHLPFIFRTREVVNKSHAPLKNREIKNALLITANSVVYIESEGRFSQSEGTCLQGARQVAAMLGYNAHSDYCTSTRIKTFRSGVRTDILFFTQFSIILQISQHTCDIRCHYSCHYSYTLSPLNRNGISPGIFDQLTCLVS